MANFILLGWVALSMLLMARRPGRRTVVGLAVLGVLFLPEVRAATHIPEMPNPMSLPGFKLTKLNAVAVGLLLGVLLFDRLRLMAFRPRWFDLPVAVWCACPLLSALANALAYDDPVSKFDPAFLGGGLLGQGVGWLEYSGLYDGITQVIDSALTWGVPYWLGRAYLADRDGVRELALWVVLGGLLYVPLCLLETRVSPQLHRWVYGFHQHDFLQSIRLGGYRPTVFLEHGIAVGLWMVTAALFAGWLWYSRLVTPVPLAPARLAVGSAGVAAVLAVTAVLCKSTGALALGAAGLAALLVARRLPVPLSVVALLCVPPTYAAVRTNGAWDGRGAVDFVARTIEEDRAASLEFRLRNEDILIDKAMQRAFVGWGGFGRNRVYDESGNDTTITDGLWVLALGERGLIGLVALQLLLLLPVGLLLTRHGAAAWRDPANGAAAVVGVALTLYAIDGLMNAMVNPVFVLMAGALAGLPARHEEIVPLTLVRPAWRVRPVAVRKRVLEEPAPPAPARLEAR